ncbi:hypothetical protein KBZ33_09785 [Cyanobium sp. Cruz-8D1]|uniref:hypothetical protein n=1 Tax=Cyanobium sp. Cruz-8D1 TaxID=2823711 RepID=UPI0028F45BC3|nr:hypothetical protein [Cyanobium sp. Cruz-8D1]MCP9859469.1 hypothetical protein [Cyanobium sp. Cruz-8H5]MCP9866589.1 hypothetical protein [Cyanobium sp. Cruz-8D1]
MAGALARRFHRRYHDLVEACDALGVAQLELVRACGRVTDPTTAPAYLKRCIQGALAHWLRDRALIVCPTAGRCPRRSDLETPVPGSAAGGQWWQLARCPRRP